ncbi:MAG: class I tRNA ligase family protein, partial [Candidatus Coatesbacteria bacterium]|nr:class I tRNA ligase family protein [Candidatus Coatesbacteria bacterium]
MFRKISTNYDQHEIEPRIMNLWKERQSFKRLVEKNKDNPRFSFLDGPITANNMMGVHHAWGRTYKDIFVRYKSMNGFHQRYQNGFDCQGLWVEVEVEKDLGLNCKSDIRAFGLDKFSEKCKERVQKYAKVIADQSMRLGQWMDWDNSYFTMTDTNIEYIWMFIKRCHDNGWLYRGTHVMPWCIRCGTSLSQHEMVDSYREVKHPSVFLRLPIVDRDNEFFLVWTTTPWTLAANTALAVNPELTYVKAEHDGRIVYLSKGTLESVLGNEARVISEHKGTEFKDWRYHGPFDELPVQDGIDHRVVCDEM